MLREEKNDAGILLEAEQVGTREYRVSASNENTSLKNTFRKEVYRQSVDEKQLKNLVLQWLQHHYDTGALDVSAPISRTQLSKDIRKDWQFRDQKMTTVLRELEQEGYLHGPNPLHKPTQRRLSKVWFDNINRETHTTHIIDGKHFLRCPVAKTREEDPSATIIDMAPKQPRTFFGFQIPEKKPNVEIWEPAA